MGTFSGVNSNDKWQVIEFWLSKKLVKVLVSNLGALKLVVPCVQLALKRQEP